MKPMRRRLCRRHFLRGYQRLESYQQRSSFGTWIYRIAVNCALNRISQPRIEAEYRHGEESDPEEKTVQVATKDADPERVLLSREISTAQEMAMQRLTATEKTAFVLRHLEERSINEIAEVLEMAPNTAKQAVFRAVQKLRRELAPLRGSA
jgi:RNA polymerase sigma-70 factor (ECF subfamily)